MLSFLQVLYTISAVGLAVVGFNTLVLSILYLVHKNNTPPQLPCIPEDKLPFVVVQLPIYNEKHVVERLVEAASRLDYPRDRLLIQVLDDSTDDTPQLTAAITDGLRADGLHIQHIRRDNRTGYKAGALAESLTRTDAPFVAIFDADFVPEPDFLRRVMPYFVTDPQLGMVQTRWAHLNASDSHLTRAQALALDAHFVVEQTARHRARLLMNFSGTAGVWRRQCIEESGGWQHDTLSEDIDLSYRAQMKGWRFLYLPDVAAPAEIPPLMMAFKRQQSRWATGTVQCLRKFSSRLLKAPLTIWQKIEGFIHLGGYILHPLMLVLLLLTLPLLLLEGLDTLPLAGLGLAMLGSPLQALLSQRYLHKNWAKKLVTYPIFMLMGTGLTVNNAIAVWKGLRSKPLPFKRTPKFRAQGTGKQWAQSAYTLPIDATTWAEIVLAVYAAVTGILAVSRFPAVVPFMLLYAGGFAYAAAVSLWQTHLARQARKKSQRALEYSTSGTK